MLRAMPPPAPRAGLRRSVRLFRDFLHEQDDPARFYTALAEDSAAMVADYVRLDGATVLDVGAGPLYFARAFESRGATYIGCDLDTGDFAHQTEATLAVAARAEQLPFADGSVDVAFSSNVLEHVEDPAVVCRELTRVVRPGGIAVAAFTNWLSPWGGHETSPWHYLGGEYAVRRYRRRHGHDPKNRVGRTLFPLSVRTMLEVAETLPDVVLEDVRPRYLPEWTRPLVKVPGARELLTWNLWVVWRKPVTHATREEADSIPLVTCPDAARVPGTAGGNR
jgi:SAM-dependent methyltransferase